MTTRRDVRAVAQPAQARSSGTTEALPHTSLKDLRRNARQTQEDLAAALGAFLLVMMLVAADRAAHLGPPGAHEAREAQDLAAPQVEADVAQNFAIGAITQSNAIEFDHRTARARRRSHDASGARHRALAEPHKRGARALMRLPVTRLSTEVKREPQRGACHARIGVFRGTP
mgnify:CR=1 FL=1